MNISKMSHDWKRYFGIILVVGSACGFLALQWAGKPKGSEKTKARLVAVRDHVTIDASVSKQSQASVRFELLNTSDGPITVESVHKSCSCLAAEDIEGRRLEANEKLDFGVVVNVPNSGSSEERIQVAYKSDDPQGHFEAPLQLVIDIRGDETEARIVRKENSHLSFVPVKSLDQKASFSVHTVEFGDRPQWFESAFAGAEELTVEMQATEEGPAGNGMVKRRYDLTVGWKELPRYPELKSGIFAKVAYGKFPNELLGSVVAHSAEEVPFQPRQLTLSPGVTREVVVFRDGDPDGWRVADNFQLPDWLNVKWSPFNGNAGMEIELRNRELPAVQSREPIEVQSRSGATFQVYVAFNP